MNDKNPDDIFRMRMEESLNEHFQKYKCKERSSALMLWATSIMEHERIMCQVRHHLNYLLGVQQLKGKEYEEAKAFYSKLIK